MIITPIEWAGESSVPALFATKGSVCTVIDGRKVVVTSKPIVGTSVSEVIAKATKMIQFRISSDRLFKKFSV